MSQHVGNYKVIRKLGEGGMGVVFLAEHAVMGRLAAVKLLLPAMSESNEAVTRFFNEARATARIKHPGIVEILDCAQTPNGQAYIVMEYLEGETLGGYVGRHGKLSSDVEVVRAILRQVANAVAAAHARSIIHRDLKPDNVFLVSEGAAGETATVKILDFGIAKLVQPGKPFAITTTRELLGTPVYISPEQCKGAKDLDHRTDIYSLGCIAFEMLTGRPVFEAASLGELIASHMFKEPPSIVELEPSVPAALSELVARMLAKAPDARPASMNDVVAAIDAAGPLPALRGAVVSLAPARPLEVVRGDAAAISSVPTLTVGEYMSHDKRVPAAPSPPAAPAATPAPGVEASRPPRRRTLVAIAGAGAAVLGLIIWLVAGRSPPAAPNVAPPAAPAVAVPAPPKVLPPPAAPTPPAVADVAKSPAATEAATVAVPKSPDEAAKEKAKSPNSRRPKTNGPKAKDAKAPATKAGPRRKTDLFLDL